MKKIRVGIAGAAGYTGGELIRLLIHHSNAELVSLFSRSNAGKQVSGVHHDLAGETELYFSDSLDQDIDVLFLCMGHGESMKFLRENILMDTIRIIDLSNDFRLAKHSFLDGRTFIYGLPELNRAAIKTSRNIANPGCFATAIQLGLLPLAKNGLLGDVYTTGITGSTGAGQTLGATSHFSWRTNNIQAYKTHTHQHLAEISQSLAQLQKTKQGSDEQTPSVHFVPWRGDFARGIFISSQLKLSLPLNEIKSLYTNFYQNEPFTSVIDEPLFLKQVVNTNKCLLQLEQVGDHLVVHSAIDNLLKGASGQAVQNMNLMFGLTETNGLKLKANYF